MMLTFLAGDIFHERLRNSLTQLSTLVAENEKQLVVLADATKAMADMVSSFQLFSSENQSLTD